MKDMLTSDLRRALAAGEVDELMRSWADPVRAEALRIYRSMNLRRRDHLDEIESMAWEVVAGLIDDERAGRTRATYAFGAFFSMRLRNHVKQWLDSEVGLAPASGMSLERRRGRRIRGAMEDRGLDVLTACRALNAEVAYMGTFSPGDLATLQDSGASIDDELTEVDVTMPAQGAYLLAPFETTAFIREVAARLDDQEAHIVTTWLETVADGDGASGSRTVARALGIRERDVRLAMEAGRRAALDVLEDSGVDINEL